MLPLLPDNIGWGEFWMRIVLTLSLGYGAMTYFQNREK